MIFMMIILLILSVILESVIPNLLRGIMPFFVIAVILVSSTLKLDNKLFYMVIFASGLIYDLLYTDALILNAFVFLFIGYLSRLIMNEKTSFLRSLFFYYLLSITYVLVMFLITYIYVPYSLIKLLIILRDSIIINTIYFSVLYLFFFLLNGFICNRNKKCSYF